MLRGVGCHAASATSQNNAGARSRRPYGKCHIYLKPFSWGIDSANLLANAYQPSSSLAQMEKGWIKVEDAKHEGAFLQPLHCGI